MQVNNLESAVRQSNEAKAETHAAIISEASRLFRQRGVEQTSVAEVMQAANKTHGGFYRHFENKDDLVLVALDHAFQEMLTEMKAGLATVPAGEALSAFIANYVSARHIDAPETGCPAAALSGELRHGSEKLKLRFGQGVREVAATLADSTDDNPHQTSDRALRAFSMAVGAVMLARACDPETADLVLQACHK